MPLATLKDLSDEELFRLVSMLDAEHEPTSLLLEIASELRRRGFAITEDFVLQSVRMLA